MSQAKCLHVVLLKACGMRSISAGRRKQFEMRAEIKVPIRRIGYAVNITRIDDGWSAAFLMPN